MALLATNRFAGDGVTTSYEINFVGKYLDKAHVFAYIEDAGTGARTPVPIVAANWLNATTLQGMPTVPVGKTMVIYRKTPAEPLVDFTNGAWLTATALDTATRQGLFKAVEAGDLGGASSGGSSGGGAVDWADVQNKPLASATVPGIVKVGANLTIDSTGTLHATGVGGGGGGAPSGPAGGVLSGTYPNPGFAVDMATQAELDAGLAGKAPTSHTHTLNQIAQSGATSGQIPQWNGTAWAPATPAAAALAVPVIVYIGDSLGSDHPNLGPSPAEHLERTLRAGGYDCKVVNLSVNGYSFHRANTTAVFGTQTVVQRAIALNPAAILVALGFNDTVMAVDGRTISTVQSDATTFFQTLRTALPSTPIVAGTELAYDKANFTPGTLKNRGVLPALMTLRSTGILSGCWSSEILEDTLSATTQGQYADFATLDTHIRSLGTVTAVITLDIWKIARLGLTSADGLHLTEAGSRLVGTTWRKAFTSVAALQALAPNLRALTYGAFDGFMNTDGTVETGGLWDLLMSPSGSDWVTDPYSHAGQHTNHQCGPWTHCNPASWFIPSKGAYKPSTLEYTTGTTFTWELRNVAPSTDVQASVNGGAYTTIGQTTHYGDYLGSGVLPVSAGTYVFRYKVGNEVHGPVSLVVIAGASTGSWQPKVISGANLASTPQSIATANSRSYIDFSGTNYTSSHPDLTLTKVGLESRIRIGVPAGKSVWIRLSVTQLVSTSAGDNTLWMLGAEFLNDSLALLSNVQLDAKYSPTANYALIMSGTLVRKLTAPTIIVPWILTSAGGSSSIASSAANGDSSFWSVEVINEI